MSESTTVQTGTTANPIASNAQDFSDSGGDIMDNFAEGVTDDGLPIGLGGEAGRQSEPASATLEADIVNGPTDEPTLPEYTDPSPPVKEEVEEVSDETIPDTTADEPATVEFSPELLLMAGYDSAEAAQDAGFKDQDHLLATVQFHASRMGDEQNLGLPESGIYGRTQEPATKADDESAKPKEVEPVVNFEIPQEKLDLMDEDVAEVFGTLTKQFEGEVARLQSKMGNRDADLAENKAAREAEEFDGALNKLDAWEAVLGKGTGQSLLSDGQSNPRSLLHLKNRNDVFEAAAKIRQVNADRNGKPMDLEQEIQFGLMQCFPKEFQQSISGTKLTGRNVSASRPTQRKTPPKSQDDKTLQAVNKAMQKTRGHGIDMKSSSGFEGPI